MTSIFNEPSCSLSITYSDGHMTIMRSFQISSRNVLLALLLRVNDVAIHRGIGNFAQIAYVVDRLRGISKGQREARMIITID